MVDCASGQIIESLGLGRDLSLHSSLNCRIRTSSTRKFPEPPLYLVLFPHFRFFSSLGLAVPKEIADNHVEPFVSDIPPAGMGRS